MIARRPLTLLFSLATLLLSYPSDTLGQNTQRATIVPASPEQAAQQAPVFTFLQGYFSALAQGDVLSLARYHPSLTPQQLATLEDYFAHTVRDLRINLRNVHVQIAADTATVSFSRTDQFVDRITERHIEKSIQLSTVLVHKGSGWQLGGLDLVAFALGNRHSQAG